MALLRHKVQVRQTNWGEILLYECFEPPVSVLRTGWWLFRNKDFTTIYSLLFHNEHPVFLLVEIKPSGHVWNNNSNSPRPLAGKQMWERFEDLGGSCFTFASLYGMSTQVCFYECNKDTGDLWPRIISFRSVEPSSSRWNLKSGQCLPWPEL